MKKMRIVYITLESLKLQTFESMNSLTLQLLCLYGGSLKLKSVLFTDTALYLGVKSLFNVNKSQ